MSVLRTINDALIAARQPVSEDLKKRERDNALLNERSIFTDANGLMAGAADSVVGGTVVDTNPTSGQIFEDNQYNDRYVQFKSGAIFTNNPFSRFKITATSFASKNFSVAEDLQALGALAGDTYLIMGHDHSGRADDMGEQIDFKDLINRAEGLPMLQALVDAIMDPDSNRLVATKANPFRTLDDSQTEENGIFEVAATVGNPFSHTFNHTLNNIPTYIIVHSTINRGGTITEFLAHWTSGQVAVQRHQISVFQDMATNTHNAVANMNATPQPTLPDNTTADVDIRNVGSSSWDLICDDSKGTQTYKALVWFG